MCGGNKNCGCNKPKDRGCGCHKEEPKRCREEKRCEERRCEEPKRCHREEPVRDCRRFNSLWDSNSICRSNIACYVNSNRGFDTKVKYIQHYHLDREFDYDY